MPSSHSPSGYQRGRGLEESDFEELITDFGDDQAPEAGQALRRIAERYGQLEVNLPIIGDSIAERVEEGASLRRLLRERVPRLHHALYDGILTNAGSYRSTADLKRGSVFFGGQQGQKRKPRYGGAPPSKIEGALDEAFAYCRRLPGKTKRLFDQRCSSKPTFITLK